MRSRGGAGRLAITAVLSAGVTVAALTMASPNAVAATSGITNGDFEAGNLTGWTPSGSAGVVNSGAHGGTYAAQVGSSSPTTGDSSIAQTFTAPTGATQLSFYYDVFCPDSVTYDWATATLTDTTTNTTTTPLAKTCTNNLGWQQATAAITAGHTYTLTLVSHDDNYPTDPTYTLYDDVALNTASPPPPPPSGGLIQVSTDPFTNTGSQHATEVEPDTFSYGSTIVASSQVGRVNNGGASDLGWDTSTDGGQTWRHGMLPGLTVNQGGQYARVSDASVAYDAKHGVWMISGLPIDSTGNAVGISLNRSTDGVNWQNPVNAIGFDGRGYDKNWTVCDNTATSPYYGNCYTEADITSAGNAEIMSTSTDGGLTWSAPSAPADAPSGLGGQPVVQPNGTVVVPFSTNGTSIRSFSSIDGGRTWGASGLVSAVQSHAVAGGLRDGEGLPSAEIDGAGKVYVAWEDCRFRSGCPANDIVLATSADGATWSAVSRVPIDAATSTVDHFIPGIGVDHATSGGTAKIGLYYYFYPNTNCTAATCQLEVGYISSANGGASWGSAQTVAGPMSMSQIASTTQGTMVGDYISTSVVNGQAIALFAVGKTPTNGQAFDEAMYAVQGGLATTGGPNTAITGPTFKAPPQPSQGPAHRQYH